MRWSARWRRCQLKVRLFWRRRRPCPVAVSGTSRARSSTMRMRCGWGRPRGLRGVDVCFFSSRRRHTRYWRDWSSDVCSSDLYGAVGLFHFIFRKKFLMISMNHDKAEGLGINVRFWDFLFYASFGFVVTSSVAIAGVLLVFCYLIVPSVGAMLFADRIGPRLALGWTMGTLGSALGCCLSFLIDLPTGATIVCTFGSVLILMFFLHLIVHHGSNNSTALAGASAAKRELP